MRFSKTHTTDMKRPFHVLMNLYVSIRWISFLSKFHTSRKRSEGMGKIEMHHTCGKNKNINDGYIKNDLRMETARGLQRLPEPNETRNLDEATRVGWLDLGAGPKGTVIPPRSPSLGQRWLDLAQPASVSIMWV